VLETVTADADIGPARYLSQVAPQLGDHNITVEYDKDNGRWKYRVTGQTDTGYCDGPWTFGCATVYRPEGFGTIFTDPCATRTFRQPLPPDCVVQCLNQERPFLIDQVRQIEAVTRAGLVKTSPGSDRGLVNLPDCSWIEGADGTVYRQWTIRLVGPGDPSGRALVYQYVVTIGPQGVLWDYNDPGQPGWQLGDFGQAWTAGGLCTNPHTYRRISDWNSDQRAHITAREDFGVSVTAIWFDGVSYHSRDLGDLGLNFSLYPTGENQFVGQVEGIPTSG
jgi:hypothetical protein